MRLGLGMNLVTGAVSTGGSLTPEQALVAAWTAAGMSGIILADDLVAPVDAPGHIVSRIDGITYTAASAAGTFLPVAAGGDGPAGRPYMRANGINQTAVGDREETVDTYCAIFRSPPGQTTWSGFGGPIDTAEGTFSNEHRLAYFQIGTTQYYVDAPPRGVRKNATSLSSPYDFGDINQWAIATVATHANTLLQVTSLMCGEGYFFIALDLVALGKWSSAPTSDQIAAAESAASTYTGIALA